MDEPCEAEEDALKGASSGVVAKQATAATAASAASELEVSCK